MKQIRAILSVLRAGRQLAHAERWKDLQLWASLLIAVAALADAFGLGFGLAPDAASAIAAALVGVGNGYLTVATTPRIGLLPSQDDGYGDR